MPLVPDLRAWPLAKAQLQLKTLGLVGHSVKVAAAVRYANCQPQTILSMTPSPGQQVTAATVVNLFYLDAKTLAASQRQAEILAKKPTVTPAHPELTQKLPAQRHRPRLVEPVKPRELFKS